MTVICVNHEMRTDQEIAELKALLALGAEALAAAEVKVQNLDQAYVLPQISVTTSADTYHSLFHVSHQRSKEFYKHHCCLETTINYRRMITRFLPRTLTKPRNKATGNVRKLSKFNQFLGWLKAPRSRDPIPSQSAVQDGDLFH